MKRIAVFALIMFTAWGCATSETKKFAKAAPSGTERIVQKAESLLINGNVKGAEGKFKQALSQYQKVDNLRAVAKLYNRLGYVNMIKGDFGKAERYVKSGLLVSEAEGFDDIVFDIRLNEAYLMLEEGKADEAGKIAGELAKGENPDVYNVLGLVKMAGGDFDGALESFSQAASLAEKAEMDSLASSAYANIGSLYLNRKESEKAIEYLKKALAIDKQNRAPLLIAQNLHMIGEAYEISGKYRKALYFYDRAYHVNLNLRLPERTEVDKEAMQRVEKLL